MSTIYNDTRAALDTQLSTASGIPTIAWEGLPFTPSGEYIAQFFLPGQTTPGSLGSTGLDQTTGIYQVNVNVPTGNGTGRLNELCDLIADRFKPRQYLAYNGVNVRLIRTTRNAGVSDGAYYTVTIDIEFETYTAQRA